MQFLGRSFLFIFLTALLSGCGGATDFSDLEEFMAEVESRPKSRIQPLPPFEQVAPFSYQASNQRSPFEPPVVVKKVERERGGVAVVPDFDRVKQYLEQYTIANLAMVGTLEQGPAFFALVRDADGGVHRVQTGDYMGTDHGEVLIIEEGSIELIEIVPDGTGGWVERARTVALGSRG
ncbi:MAG: pilus assembly protein PilP [Gammaproteobacteria bacterium]|nr:pilus assembly protein PilP [Gammaproteobacteria bacterium]